MDSQEFYTVFCDIRAKVGDRMHDYLTPVPKSVSLAPEINNVGASKSYHRQPLLLMCKTEKKRQWGFCSGIQRQSFDEMAIADTAPRNPTECTSQWKDCQGSSAPSEEVR